MRGEAVYPHLTQFEENRIELERERQLRREIRAARDEARARRKASSPSFLARVRQAVSRPEPCAVPPCPEPA